jgi:two-component system OmpR family sensor kinase
MTWRSLQARAVAAAALAILLALVVVGVGVDLLVSRHLHRTLDRTLRERAVEVAQLSASAPALLTRPGALDSPIGGAQPIVEVVDRHGRIVARSLSLGGRVLPTGPLVHSAIDQGRTGYVDTRLGNDELRAYTAPLADFGGPAAGGAVVVGASTRDLRETLASLHLFLLASALVAAALAALTVALLLRRALRPLSRLAAAASEIERTGDSRRRLPESPSADEIGQLAATLNAMLGSLERAREGERRFLADASHELRTPLTALRGNVAYLTRQGATPELVADLARDAERLARLADDLLVVSREESADAPREVVRLDELAAATQKDGIEVVAPEPVEALGDREALERALANLVENAQRYGPEGGRVTIAVERADSCGRLTVSDEGPGVAAEESEQVFERFWRGREDVPGSGLGLAIVKAIAERHGGRAYAEGSRFTIELPALKDFSELTGRKVEEDLEKGTP